MRIIIPQLTLFILFWIVTFLLRNESIYHSTLNKVSTNSVRTDSGIDQTNNPFIQITNENLVYYDAGHYLYIKNHGYKMDETHSDGIFGFFPMFAYIWKITFLNARGMIFFNFFLFLTGLVILNKQFPATSDSFRDWGLAVMPGLIAFIIPYSEAVFFVTIIIGIYGRLKNNYKLYFTGMLLASMTRPVAVLLIASFIVTEFILFISTGNIKQRLISCGKNFLPVIMGTFLVCLIQLLYKSKSLFKFAEVQTYWDHYFSAQRLVTRRFWNEPRIVRINWHTAHRNRFLHYFQKNH